MVDNSCTAPEETREREVNESKQTAISFSCFRKRNKPAQVDSRQLRRALQHMAFAQASITACRGMCTAHRRRQQHNPCIFRSMIYLTAQNDKNKGTKTEITGIRRGALHLRLIHSASLTSIARK